jgi:hypothetical protein
MELQKVNVSVHCKLLRLTGPSDLDVAEYIGDVLTLG